MNNINVFNNEHHQLVTVGDKYVGIQFGNELFPFDRGVGNFLRFIRTKLNMSLDMVAQHLEKTSASISQIERGERNATPQTLRQLSELFHIESHYLLLLTLDGVLKPEELVQLYKASATPSPITSVDLQELLMSDRSVFYQSRELSQKEKYMLLGALKIVL